MDGTADPRRGPRHVRARASSRTSCASWKGRADAGQGTSCRRRRRPDQAPGHPRRRVDGRPRPRGRVPGPRRRRDDLERHRRRRHRQGPRLLRGRDDAGAVPGRRPRRAPASRCSACTPPARSAAPRRIVASQLVQAGIHERVLTVAFEKQSESEAMWALSLPMPFTPPLHAGAGGYFAPHVRSYMARSEVARPHRDPGGAQGPAERAQEPLRPPPRARHHLRLHQGLDDAVGPDPLRGDVPVERRRLRDGARPARRWPTGATKPVAWVQGHGHALRADDVGRPRHRAARAAAPTAPPTSTGRPASPIPAREVDCVEMYVPFSWFEPMWLENLGFAGAGRGLEASSRTASRSSTATCP